MRYAQLETTHMARYQLEIRHEGLKNYRCLTGSDPSILKARAAVIIHQWEEQWARLRARQEAHTEALERTREATRTLNELESMLVRALQTQHAVDWDRLKRKEVFLEPPPRPRLLEAPPFDEPRRSMIQFQPRLGILDYLLPRRRAKRIEEANRLFEKAHKEWEEAVREIETVNRTRIQASDRERAGWEERRRRFQQEREQQHSSIDELRLRYLNGDPDAVEEYCDIVLANSQYPDFFPQEFELEYNPENKILIVEYRLLSPSQIPRLQEVKYIRSRNELKEVWITDSRANQLFDVICYQICLRTVHEIFEADVVGAIAAVAFNGWVDFVDPATGHETKACILSLQVSKEEFEQINLAAVDPKTCFRNLKGVSSSRLHGLAPVPPLIRMTRSDPRFVESQAIAAKLEEGVNLATMEWSDFEHLVRELFEAQFKQTGGEVKVTQASRDGGVDAVVFDPDPIRGGKIVIQAKRYTNPVGVNAVRDLYGTVVNEGAIKGILVTTSTYGPDAYKFAKDKPITLLDGSNLLHMMAGLGHTVRINLQEAKQIARN